MKVVIGKFISSGMIIIIGNFINQGIVFLSAPLFSRIMSPDDFGIFSSFLAFVQIIQIFFTLNIQSSLYNSKLDLNEQDNKIYLKNMTIFIIINSIIICFFILFVFRSLVLSIFKININCLYLGCFYTFFYSIYLLITSYFISNREKKQCTILVTIISFLYSFFNIFLSLIFVLNISGDKYIGRVYGMFLSTAILFPFIIYYIYKINHKLKSNCKRLIKDIKYGLKITIPLIFHSLSSIVLSKMDQIMLLNTISAYSAGVFSYGNNFSHIFSTITQAFNSVYLPWYMEKKLKNEQHLIINSYRKYRNFIFYIFCIFNLCIPEVIYISSSREYYSALNSIQIVCLGFFFNYMYFFIVNYETYYKKTSFIALGTVLSGIVNLILNALLIKPYQDVGAAFATMISYLCLLVFHIIIVKKNIKMYLEYNIKEILLFCLLASIVCTLTIILRDYIYIRYFLLLILMIYKIIEYRRRNIL